MRRALPFLIVVAMSVVFEPAALATSGTMTITSSLTLGADYHGAIVIAADDVTLNCAGHSVIGPNADGWPDDGIYVEQHSDVTIENCVVREMANSGIGLVGVTGGSLIGNTTTDNQASGFDVNDSSNVTVSGNRSVSNHQAGYSSYGSRALMMTANQAVGDWGDGFAAHGSTGMTWHGNSSIKNVGVGFGLYEESADNTIDRNLAAGNQGPGFVIDHEDESVYTGNVSRHNGGSGFDLFSGSGNVLRGNSSEGNGGYGFGLWNEAAGDSVVMNQVSANGAEGIALVYGATGNRVVGNTSRGNQAEGISMYFGANDNTVRDNIVSGNAGSGILVHESSGNLIVGNRSTRNNSQMDQQAGGIAVRFGSSYNDMVKNVACGNGVTDGYEEASSSHNTWVGNRLCMTDISTNSAPYVTVDISGFTGPDCSAPVVDISNKGDAEQPFGWTLTLRVPEAGIDQTYEGQQPLSAGVSFETIMATGLSDPGTYTVTVAPGEVLGPSREGSAGLTLPATC